MCEVFFSFGFKLKLKSEEKSGKGGEGRLWGRRVEIRQSGERDG